MGIAQFEFGAQNNANTTTAHTTRRRTRASPKIKPIVGTIHTPAANHEIGAISNVVNPTRTIAVSSSPASCARRARHKPYAPTTRPTGIHSQCGPPYREMNPSSVWLLKKPGGPGLLTLNASWKKYFADADGSSKAAPPQQTASVAIARQAARRCRQKNR